MKLYLYNNKSSDNTINKDIDLLDTLDIHLSNNENILTPTLLLTRKDNVNYDLVNYAKLLDRFYFVDTRNYKNNKFIILNCGEDVLETYKDNILNSNQDIIRKSSAGNIKQENVLPTTISKTFNSNTTLPKSSSIIMVTAGQPINTGSNNKDDTRG